MKAGIQINFYLGQKVRLKEDGRTGTLLVLDGTNRGDEGIQATVFLDVPYRFPSTKNNREFFIHSQTVGLLDIEPVTDVEDPEEILG